MIDIPWVLINRFPAGVQSYTFDGISRPLGTRQYKRTNESFLLTECHDWCLAITLVKRSQVLPRFLPPPSRPSRPSLQCPPHPIAMAHHSAIAIPRQGERRSCNLGFAITARFNAMMIAKLVYAAICAARITTKGSWVIGYPGNSAYRPLNLLSPSQNVREPSRRLFRAFRTSLFALFGHDEAGAPKYMVSTCKDPTLELSRIAY